MRMPLSMRVDADRVVYNYLIAPLSLYLNPTPPYFFYFPLVDVGDHTRPLPSAPELQGRERGYGSDTLNDRLASEQAASRTRVGRESCARLIHRANNEIKKTPPRAVRRFIIESGERATHRRSEQCGVGALTNFAVRKKKKSVTRRRPVAASCDCMLVNFHFCASMKECSRKRAVSARRSSTLPYDWESVGSVHVKLCGADDVVALTTKVITSPQVALEYGREVAVSAVACRALSESYSGPLSPYRRLNPVSSDLSSTTPWTLTLSMGGGDHLLLAGSSGRLPLEYAIKKTLLNRSRRNPPSPWSIRLDKHRQKIIIKPTLQREARDAFVRASVNLSPRSLPTALTVQHSIYNIRTCPQAYEGCGWESLMKSVTLGNVTMSHRTREGRRMPRLSPTQL
ncbi:hypothetical protein EVAR_53619_1 [Eumeta japonica]|uniref:Uncharacterized protein n=1 Tax=Eumeta variegata TaxID=151549 RepID=A0A4C1X2P2_EUMVA|nr:hypothetical protein EVAR_53619_1 [Eumeta japonica]